MPLTAHLKPPKPSEGNGNAVNDGWRWDEEGNALFWSNARNYSRFDLYIYHAATLQSAISGSATAKVHKGAGPTPTLLWANDGSYGGHLIQVDSICGRYVLVSHATSFEHGRLLRFELSENLREVVEIVDVGGDVLSVCINMFSTNADRNSLYRRYYSEQIQRRDVIDVHCISCQPS